MNHRLNIRYLLAVALISGLGVSSAVAADYPPTLETPVTKIPTNFKPTAPGKIFTTFFNHTLLTIKAGETTRPIVAGFKKNSPVSDTVTLPSGLKVKFFNLHTDKNGKVILPTVYFQKKGTYLVTVTVDGVKKDIKITVN